MGTRLGIRPLGVALAILAIGAVIGALGSTARADWPDPSVNLAVWAHTGSQRNVSICSDGAGGAYIAWQDMDTQGNLRLRVSRVLSTGAIAPGFETPPAVATVNGWAEDGDYHLGFFPTIVPGG